MVSQKLSGVVNMAGFSSQSGKTESSPWHPKKIIFDRDLFLIPSSFDIITAGIFYDSYN